MKLVLLTFASQEGAARWDAMTSEARRADIERHREWFREHGAAVVGGEELAPPHRTWTVRRIEGRSHSTEGPHEPSRDWLSGIIVVEAEDVGAAIAMAAEWPGLDYPGHFIEVRPIDETPA